MKNRKIFTLINYKRSNLESLMLSQSFYYTYIQYIICILAKFKKIQNPKRDGNDDENENYNRNRAMSLSTPFYFSKTIRKVFKLPSFSKLVFYPSACIEALTKELEVNFL